MTIWILAVLLVASLIGLGLRQGAIRVAASFVGIVLGTLLAGPIGNLLKPVFSAIGMKNPVLLWFVPALLVFVLILTLSKVAGLFIHKKVEVHYKYKAGDLRLALWERLNSRLGMCLGTLNAIAYMVLVSQAIYMLSYWTFQAQTDSDARSVRMVNRLGKDLQGTGMSKVAKSVDDTPAEYYDAADVAGLLFQTPALEQRLQRYPGLLGLAERPELQDLANDEGFSQLREQGASISEVLKYPKVQAILNNREVVKSIESAILPNLKDLHGFLTNGTSTKYTERILGRWTFDVNGSLGLFRREKPTMSSREMAQRKALLTAAASGGVLIVTPEQQVFFKGIPFARSGTLAPNIQSNQGEWKEQSGTYQFTVTIDGKTEQLSAEIHGSRLQVTGGELLGLAFSREE
ncbi:MAG TPA: CvpA family protein [Verrucomicrobiae bacterium]|nr:CvpA family protein [Verrucomicrobiae bacterium]